MATQDFHVIEGSTFLDRLHNFVLPSFLLLLLAGPFQSSDPDAPTELFKAFALTGSDDIVTWGEVFAKVVQAERVLECDDVVAEAQTACFADGGLESLQGFLVVHFHKVQLQSVGASFIGKCNLNPFSIFVGRPRLPGSSALLGSRGSRFGRGRGRGRFGRG